MWFAYNGHPNCLLWPYLQVHWGLPCYLKPWNHISQWKGCGLEWPSSATLNIFCSMAKPSQTIPAMTLLTSLLLTPSLVAMCTLNIPGRKNWTSKKKSILLIVFFHHYGRPDFCPRLQQSQKSSVAFHTDTKSVLHWCLTSLVGVRITRPESLAF